MVSSFNIAVTEITSDFERSWPGSGIPKRMWLALVDPGVQATLLLRIQTSLSRSHLGFCAALVRRINHAINGIDVVLGAEFGKALVIRHPAGIVVGRRAKLGDNVTVLQNVTIGQRNIRPGDPSDCPKILSNVVIGAGAVVVGAITVGRDAVVGANAFVDKNVPPAHLAVGIPAQFRPRLDIESSEETIDANNN